MADEKRGKLGDIIEVRVSKRRKPAASAAKPDDRRYGLYPILDEIPRTQRKKGLLHVTLLDLQSRFDQNPVTSILTSIQRELYYAPDYINNTGRGRLNSLPFVDLAQSTPVRWYTAPGVYTEYRQGWNRLPLSYAESAYYGLIFHLGGESLAVDPSEPSWTERKSPSDRQADLIALDAETGSDHSAEIALLDYEIDEWAAAYYSANNYWNDHLTDWYKNYATFEKKPKKQVAWSIEGGGVHFEPFDPFDTDNYKVTTGSTYASAEVEAPKIPNTGEADLIIGLFPRDWTATVNYNAWHFSPHFDMTPSIIFKRERTASITCRATTSPMVRTFHGVTNDYTIVQSTLPGGIYGAAVTHDATHSTSRDVDGSPNALDHIVEMLDWRLNTNGEGDGLSSVAGVDALWQFSQSPWSNWLLERTDATLAVQTADSDEGKQVGAFKIGGTTYNVWRKTTRAGGDTVLATTGLDATINFTSLEPSITGSYITKEFNSYSHDFAYYDPSGIYDHQTV